MEHAAGAACPRLVRAVRDLSRGRSPFPRGLLLRVFRRYRVALHCEAAFSWRDSGKIPRIPHEPALSLRRRPRTGTWRHGRRLRGRRYPAGPQGRDQGPADGTGASRKAPLRPGSTRRVRAESSKHHHHPRHRRRRGRRLHRDGARRRHASQPAFARWADGRRSRARLRPSDRRRARSLPFRRHRSSRPEAGQRDGDGRGPDQGARFRSGEIDSRAGRGCRCRDRDRGTSYRARCGRRHQRLHVARADARATGRCAVGRLLVRRRVVRAPRRTPGVRWPIRVGGDERGRARSADAVAGPSAGRSRSPQAHRRPLPRKGSGAPLSIGR